ncbi:50S ribosomal protein L32e [Candidatus Micrarchaeota archaeon]|nr:50S ribosomal protein L32e [Candidatus Micrarchaeota archaeon]
MAPHPKTPNFVRANSYKRRVSRTGWRKPRGIDSKQRIMWKSTPNMPKIGYGTAKATRHFHPSGKAEVLVHNEKELAGVKNAVVRFSGSMGRKKYLVLKKKAHDMKLKVLN